MSVRRGITREGATMPARKASRGQAHGAPGRRACWRGRRGLCHARGLPTSCISAAICMSRLYVSTSFSVVSATGRYRRNSGTPHGHEVTVTKTCRQCTNCEVYLRWQRSWRGWGRGGEGGGERGRREGECWWRRRWRRCSGWRPTRRHWRRGLGRQAAYIRTLSEWSIVKCSICSRSHTATRPTSGKRHLCLRQYGARMSE